MASQSDIHFHKVYGVLSCTRRLKEVPETVTYLLVGVDKIVQAGLGKVKCVLIGAYRPVCRWFQCRLFNMLPSSEK